MKIRFFLCLAVLLLVLTGCRRVGPTVSSPGSTPPVVNTAPGITAPAVSQPPTVSTPTAPAPASSAPAPSGSVSQGTAPANGVPPTGTPAVSTPADGNTSSRTAATEQEVNATLDDILKQLNDLDQLFSQMDNIKESDLG